MHCWRMFALHNQSCCSMLQAVWAVATVVVLLHRHGLWTRGGQLCCTDCMLSLKLVIMHWLLPSVRLFGRWCAPLYHYDTDDNYNALLNGLPHPSHSIVRRRRGHMQGSPRCDPGAACLSSFRRPIRWVAVGSVSQSVGTDPRTDSFDCHGTHLPSGQAHGISDIIVSAQAKWLTRKLFIRAGDQSSHARKRRRGRFYI
jgi:hypothetical protein